MTDAPKRIWMSAIDEEGEAVVWFDPDEGGTAYVHADLLEAVESARDCMGNLWAKAMAENERLREALERIAAGKGVYGIQASEYKSIARAALCSTEASHD